MKQFFKNLFDIILITICWGIMLYVISHLLIELSIDIITYFSHL